MFANIPHPGGTQQGIGNRMKDDVGIRMTQQPETVFDTNAAKNQWSAFEHLPLFGVANRINAYNTYLQMEREP